MGTGTSRRIFTHKNNNAIQERKKCKFDLIKIKNICSVEDPVKMKRQIMDWENIFANRISDKEFVTRKYKDLSAAKTNKQSN